MNAIEMNRLIGISRCEVFVPHTFELMKNIVAEEKYGIYEPGKDEYKCIWIRIKNPTLEEFREYTKDDYYDDEDPDFYYKYDYYDEEYSYFRITYIKITNGYCTLSINRNIVYTYDPRKEEVYPMIPVENIDRDLIEIEEEIQKSVQLIKENKYQEVILDNIPWRYKTGTVPRDIFWKVLGEEGKEEFEFPNRDKFLSLYEDGEFNKPIERLEKMTAAVFFNACYAGYMENSYLEDYKDVTKLSSIEAYKAYADGRDGGLLDINPNSSEAYEAWMNSKERYGEHPWEVCRGGNSTHIDLYVQKDEKGYYFIVSGKAEGRFVESINFYMAIRRLGYPVKLNNVDDFYNRLTGKELLGIVPNGVIPKYCEEMFPNEHVISFMNLYDEEEALAPYVRWYKFSIPKIE